ncbi:MAG: acyl-CoA dehydratase activase [Candidatus Thorarchaeota archaeon]
MSKFGIGIDVGSTTAKGVLIDSEKKVRAKYIMQTGAAASKAINEILKEIESHSGLQLDSIAIVGTGYGRARIENATKTVTEITCHKDAKVIRIGKDGRPEDFELNDKCSAGTGRFLEVMARVLEVTLDELGPLALQSNSPSSISNTCTVFAESEVIGHIGAGEEPADIAAGIHESMTTKIGSLAKRVKVVPPVCVTGGVALNPAFRHYLSKHLGTELWIPEEPQLTGALGAAVEALKL